MQSTSFRTHADATDWHHSDWHVIKFEFCPIKSKPKPGLHSPWSWIVLANVDAWRGTWCWNVPRFFHPTEGNSISRGPLFFVTFGRSWVEQSMSLLGEVTSQSCVYSRHCHQRVASFAWRTKSKVILWWNYCLLEIFFLRMWVVRAFSWGIRWKPFDGATTVAGFL